MRRRQFLVTSGSSMVVVAGCAGSSDEIKDTDGDGVIDREDYAPKDPDVQEKADIQKTQSLVASPTSHPTDRTTSTPSPSPTPTPTRTPTPTSTPTPTPEPNTLTVDDSYWKKSSHIKEFSGDHVTVVVDPEYPSTDFDSTKVYVGLWEFPRNDVIAEELSSEFTNDGGSVTRTINLNSINLDSLTEYHYYVGLVPGNTYSTDDIEHEQTVGIMETDPFVMESGGGNIKRATYPGELSDESGNNHSRNSVEGAYQLELSGRTSGRDWTVSFFAFKSAHAETLEKSRGRSRPEYVSYELTSGTGTELANLLKEEAKDRDYTDREAIEFVIDFVQSLPYVPDDVSTGFDDYTKFIMETLPEMGGDCEDTSILLASVLQAKPFNYDMILIQPPGHMAVGIWQSEPEGYYYEFEGRKYSYIETTGQGWGIGDCPEEYQGEEAYLYQV